MSLDRDQVAEVFAEALERPPGERDAFLDTRCATSSELRAEVLSLLAAHERSPGFLSQLDREHGAALLAADVPLARVGPYRLLRELGRGGMGVVYLAERAEGGFEQRAAVKLVKRGMDTDAILQRFLRERQILARLEHPNIARLLDGGATEDGQPYFAMEYVDGVPLTLHCDAHALGVDERLRLFEEATRAVQHAHGQLIVHRDLKPSNILVARDGQLKLLDFGVAKVLGDGSDDTELTRTGRGPMTPEYAAPEQVRGEPVTTATDVYALGLVLYELLAGRRPFEPSLSGEALARATCETEPSPPSAVVDGRSRRAREVRGDLDAVVLHALSKEPSRRYASAEALAEDVRRHRAGRPVLARPDSVRYRAVKFIRRHKLGVAAATAAALSLLVGLVGTAWQAKVAARERDRARQEAERAEKVNAFLLGLFKASDPGESKGREVTARELLERGLERIESELSGQPAVQAELLHTMAISLYEIGQRERARVATEKALAAARQAHGPEHPVVARELYLLGQSLYAVDRYEEAESVARQALAMRRRLLPADAPDLAESLAGLGLVLTGRTKLEEAERLEREGLAIREKSLGHDHVATAESYLYLGNVAQVRSDYPTAIRMHSEAVAIRRKVLGSGHHSLATALMALGNAQVGSGDLESAAASLREAVAIDKKILGPEHTMVAQTVRALAVMLHTKGDLAGAEAGYREALAIDRKTKGGAQTSSAQFMTNLAHVLSDQGRFAEAMPLFEQALRIHTGLSGADHLYVASTLEPLAASLILQGRAREALPVLDRCLAIRQRRLDAAHPGVIAARIKVAEARAALGELGPAERAFREVLEAQRRAHPEGGRPTVVILTGLGEVLTRQDRVAEAEPLLREALRLSRDAMPAGHWRHGDIASVVGAGLWKAGRRGEGGPLLVSGRDLLVAKLGASHPITRRAQHRLDAAGGPSAVRAGVS